MKSLKILFIAVLFLSVASFAQEVEDNRLTVYGKVKVFTKADRANIVFQLKGVGSSLKSAFEDAEEQMSTVSARLESIGLGKKNISTSFFQSSENYGDKAFLSSKKDYRAMMTVAITTDSLELLEPAVVILSESNVERISSISFDLIDYSDLRKRGLKEAIVKAKEKADLVSKELGLMCGDILSVEEIESPGPESRAITFGRYATPFNVPFFAQESSSYEKQDEASIYSQEISFFSEVKVVFEMVNNKSSKADTKAGDDSKK
jgi:uncharacterized protein YggE